MISVLSDLFYSVRNKVLSSERSLRFLSDFPVSRPIAKRESRAAFDLCAGFVYSQVLLACIELRLLDHLADAPISLPEIARKTGLNEEAAARLLDAATSLRLCSKRPHGRFGLGQLGAVIRVNAGLRQMIEHHAILYRDLADPVALLRNGMASTGTREFWAYARRAEPSQIGRQDVSRYTSLMAASATVLAQDVLDAYPLDRYSTLLDVGGGDGTFALDAARRHSGLRTTTLDLPAVASIAAEKLAASGLGARCRAVGGNMLDGTPTELYDVAILVRVLIDHDTPSVRKILRYCRASLKPGGVLLIAEPQADAAGFERVGAAYFGFYLLAMGQGRARSFDELSELLSAEGFARPRRIPTRTPLVTGLIAADHN
ncbi:MAG: methyltransferase [Hyphomicrobiaceae bacterium]